jgi:hypothetical protein
VAPNDEWRRGLLDPNPEEQLGVVMKEAILDKVRLGVRIPVDAQIWSDMHVSTMQALDYMTDQVIFQFETTAFKEKLPPQSISKVVEFTKPVTVEMYQPSSPWQMWKRNHRQGRWIGWLVRKFPKCKFETLSHTKVVHHTETVTVDLHHSVIYPKAKAIASPHMGSIAIRWVEPVWK